MSQLQIIDQREVLGKDFKIYGDFENPLFLARDVAEWIDYDVEQVGKLLALVDDSEKLTLTILRSGQNRQMWFLTEDGLYEVLMQSRKPIAKEFKKQVKEILRSVRKTGTYSLAPVSPLVEAARIVSRCNRLTLPYALDYLNQAGYPVTLPPPDNEVMQLLQQTNMKFAEIYRRTGISKALLTNYKYGRHTPGEKNSRLIVEILA